METFKIVAEVSYQDKEFYVLLDKTCQRYFLRKLEDGSIMYPTLEEFIALFSKFNRKKVDYAMLKRPHRRYRLNPKVITKVGKSIIAIPLVTVMALCCQSCHILEEIVPDIDISNFGEEKNGAKKEELIDYYKEMGFEFEEIKGYEDEDYYTLKQSVELNAGIKKIYTTDRAQFAECVNTPLSPSYSVVKETLSNNPKVPDKYKEIIIQGLDNLENLMPDLDLTVLNFNMNRLEIVKVSEEEMADKANKNFMGVFNVSTAQVYVTEDGEDFVNEFTILHECLGHACTEAKVEGLPIDEHITYAAKDYEITKLDMIISNYNYTARFIKDDTKSALGLGNMVYGLLGYGQEEGKADWIASAAINKKLIGLPYEPASEMLRILLRTLDVSIRDYVNNGGVTYLNNKLQEAGVENSLQLIATMDIFDDALQGKDGEIRITEGMPMIEESILDFIMDYSKAQLESGKMTKDELVEKFSEIMAECPLETIHVYLDGLSDIDVNELKEDISESMENLEIDGDIKE